MRGGRPAAVFTSQRRFAAAARRSPLLHCAYAQLDVSRAGFMSAARWEAPPPLLVRSDGGGKPWGPAALCIHTDPTSRIARRRCFRATRGLLHRRGDEAGAHRRSGRDRPRAPAVRVCRRGRGRDRRSVEDAALIRRGNPPDDIAVLVLRVPADLRSLPMLPNAKSWVNPGADEPGHRPRGEGG